MRFVLKKELFLIGLKLYVSLLNFVDVSPGIKGSDNI